MAGYKFNPLEGAFDLVGSGGGDGYAQRSQTIVDDTEILQDTTYVYLASEGTTIEDPLVDGHVIVVYAPGGGTITGNIYAQPDSAFPMSPGTYLFCALNATPLGVEGMTWIPMPTSDSGGSQSVTSVNGQTGDVTLTAADLGAARNLGWRIVGYDEEFTTLAAAMSASDYNLSNFIYVKSGYYEEPAYTHTGPYPFTIISDNSRHSLRGDWDLGSGGFNIKGLGINGVGGQYSLTMNSTTLYDCSVTGLEEFTTRDLTAINSELRLHSWSSYRTRVYNCLIQASSGGNHGITETHSFIAKDSSIEGYGGIVMSPILKTDFDGLGRFIDINSCRIDYGISMQSGVISNSRINGAFGVEIVDQTDSVIFANNTLSQTIDYGDKRGTSLRATGDGTHNVVVSGNQFANNTAIGVADAIVNISTNNAKITDNHVYTTSKSPSISGIRVTGDRNIVSNNTIKTISTGITVASGTNNIIAQNVTTDVVTPITDGGTTTQLANNVT